MRSCPSLCPLIWHGVLRECGRQICRPVSWGWLFCPIPNSVLTEVCPAVHICLSRPSNEPLYRALVWPCTLGGSLASVYPSSAIAGNGLSLRWRPGSSQAHAFRSFGIRWGCPRPVPRLARWCCGHRSFTPSGVGSTTAVFAWPLRPSCVLTFALVTAP